MAFGVDPAKVLQEPRKAAKRPATKGAFKKGQPSANPAGRPPGSKNKRTTAAAELAERLGIDPLEILLKIADNRFAELNPDLTPDQLLNKDGLPRSIAIDVRRMAATDASKFLYPTLKALEVTGKDGGPMEHLLSLTPEELARREAELAVALGDD